MGKAISDLMRQRLTQQKASLSESSVISMKAFLEGRFRCLPMPAADPTPGTKYLGLYCKPLKKGTTSPMAYGKPCPILDLLAEKRQGATKEEKQAMSQIVNANVEYWMPVVDRTDVGSVASPKIKLLPCKKTPYKQIVEYMLADASGEDITDPDAGRDFLYKKTGTGLDTEYSVVKFYDASPIHDDPELQAATLKKYAELDVPSRFWPVDWEVLGQMYQLLSDGAPMPPEYKAQFDVQSAAPDEEDDLGDILPDPPLKSAASKAPAKTGVKAPTPPPPPEPEVSDVASSDEGVSLEVGLSVSFSITEEDGTVTEHTGKVSVLTGEPDDGGDVPIDVISDLDGGVYGLWWSLVTPIADEPEPPPVEVPPTKAPVAKTAVAKAPVKMPTPVKAATKPPAPKAAVVAPKPAVKPPPPKKPVASGAIAAKLAQMKK